MYAKYSIIFFIEKYMLSFRFGVSCALVLVPVERLRERAKAVVGGSCDFKLRQNLSRSLDAMLV